MNQEPPVRMRMAWGQIRSLRMNLNPFILKKILLISMVFAFYFMSLHFKGSKETLRSDGPLSSSSHVRSLRWIKDNEMTQMESPHNHPQSSPHHQHHNHPRSLLVRKIRQKPNHPHSSNSTKEESAATDDKNKNDEAGRGGFKVKNGTKPHHHHQHSTSGNSTFIEASTPKPIIQLVPSEKFECEAPAYLQFPPDLFGQYLRSHGALVVHLLVVCYMFYCLAVVCDNYFLPSLEECSQRLGLSDDVAGATFMAAGSSAPELFTALLGVFIAKGDVGTGTIVGSAVFNILFVIGLCGVFTASAPLNWWPVLRDSAYYALTVLVLILVIFDGEVGTFESSLMLSLYVVYILVMKFNVQLRDIAIQYIPVQKWGLEPHANLDEDEDVFTQDALPIETTGNKTYQSFEQADGASADPLANAWGAPETPKPTVSWGTSYDGGWDNEYERQSNTQFPSTVDPKKKDKNYLPPSEDPRKTSLFEAANKLILRHPRLFRFKLRFIAAANLIIIKNRKRKRSVRINEVKKAGPSKAAQKRAISAVRQDTVIGNRKPSVVSEGISNEWLSAPNPLVVGWWPVVQWSLTYPLHAALYYTIPDCTRKPKWFMVTFFMSITWTAFLSYIMVWMVVIIGFTLGVPDSVMGITFLAAGTSIPDAYASIHVARAGQADMAVSNSIGSNVFDILIGLALPWFLETAVVYPGSTAVVKSMGLAYTVGLLFVTLFATVGLIHLFKWTLNPKLGISLLVVYALFLVVAVALEYNLFGAVNPPMCS